MVADEVKEDKRGGTYIKNGCAGSEMLVFHEFAAFLMQFVVFLFIVHLFKKLDRSGHFRQQVNLV